MSDHAGKSISVWMAAGRLPDFPMLNKNEHTDVCIIGAGIAGLTTAYLLGQVGKSVIVLDDGPIVSGDTERTTAHLTAVLDERYFDLERLHGEKGARLAAESHCAAITKIEHIIKKEKIDCDFERVDGYLFAPPQDSTQAIEREFAAVQRAGFNEAKIIARTPFAGFNTGLALQFPKQAQFHPLKYLAALAECIVRDGGRIFTQTHASKITGGEPARVETREGAVVTADAVVVATHTPVNDLLTIHTKQAPYRTFVIAAPVPAESVVKGLFWDTADPYHYVRLQPLPPGKASVLASQLLIVGGEDHKTGQADDAPARYQRLEDWARTIFPMMGRIKYRWSGQVFDTIDGLGYIGRNPKDEPNVFIATGFCGNGMTYGTLAGMMLTDMIRGHKNSYESLYEPARKTLRAAKDYASENLNVALQYGDWLTKGEVAHEAAIVPGSGAVVRRGLKKIAVYCDETGMRYECSAVCPHLEGIVTWNHAEQTWDCPCHGSRFDKFGAVINGPAISNLTPVENQPLVKPLNLPTKHHNQPKL